jgi:phospholipase C
MGESDWALSRRELLQRTAYAAGLAGVAGLPLETVFAEQAKASLRSSQLPSPRNLPIDHFVFLMMENRSFDTYFGWLHGQADGVQKLSYKDPAGISYPTRHHSTLGPGAVQWEGCGHPDPGHGWDNGRAQLNGGFLAPGSGNDVFALTYYNQGELAFIHEAARHYTLYDRYFASILSSTFPNRYYKWSAQSGGKINNDLPVGSAGNQWETIFDRAIPRGVSARYYASDQPFSAVWGPRAVPWTNPIDRYYADCAAGTLPNITIVDPPFKDGSGGNGTSADEHPLGDVRLGQAFMADVVNAFVASPNYRRGALFIIYDEWGGFFDHVRPPRVPDDRSTRNLETDFGQMGFRVPSVSVSPYTRNRSSSFRVDHGVHAHESILKLIAYRFGLGYLNRRHRYARNIGHSFDWKHPDFMPPKLPDPQTIVTQPCGSDTVIDEARAHENDLVSLEHLAERAGVPVYEGKHHHIFTKPDAVKRGLAAARRRERRRERAHAARAARHHKR